MHSLHLWSTILSLSHFLLFSLLPSSHRAPVPRKECCMYLFLQQRSCWSQDLWLCSGPHLLSQLHCLVPGAMEVQGSLMCCRSLIRQGQTNPDEREVGKWVEIWFILLSNALFWVSQFASTYRLFLCASLHYAAVAYCMSLPQNWSHICRDREKKEKSQSRRVKLLEKLKMSPTFLAIKKLRPSLKQSENARCLVHLGLLTTRHIVKSHPRSVSSSLPASALVWPRAQRLCYVHPDVILDSWVQQVNLGDNKWKKNTTFLDLAGCGLCKVAWKIMRGEILCLHLQYLFTHRTSSYYVKSLRALRETTWQGGRAICTNCYIPLLLLTPCPPEGNKTLNNTN